MSGIGHRPRLYTCLRSLFLLESSAQAMWHLMLVAQNLIDVISHQSSTMCVSTFRDNPVHLSKHIALGTVLPSPAHTMTVDPASSRMVEVQGKGENENEETTITDNAEAWEDERRVGLDR